LRVIKVVLVRRAVAAMALSGILILKSRLNFAANLAEFYLKIERRLYRRSDNKLLR